MSGNKRNCLKQCPVSGSSTNNKEIDNFMLTSENFFEKEYLAVSA